MAEEIKEVTIEQVMEAVTELRTAAETKDGELSAEYKLMFEKTEKTINDYESKNQEIVKKQADIDKKALDLEERVQDFELRMAKKSLDGVNYKEQPEYKAYNKLIQFGENRLDDGETKLLRLDSAPDGGFLATNEMDTEIIKGITEISPIRSVSRVKSVGKRTVDIVVRKTIPVATYEGETEEGDESNSAYGAEQLTTYRQTLTVPFTRDILMDSNFDLMSEINSDVNEGFGYGEGVKFVLGTGVKQPEGFLSNDVVVAAAIETLTASTLSGDDILILQGELKKGYNPYFCLNRQVLAKIRTLKASDGQYLWMPGLNGKTNNSLAGDPYIIAQDMPAFADSALIITYADFRRGYTITDRTGMSVIRDDLTRKKAGIIELTFQRYNTGQVTLAEAFATLKVKPT